MDSYPVSDELKYWLDRHGMRSRTAGTVALHGKGAGTKVEEAFAPATANSGRDRAPMGIKGPGIAPGQVVRNKPHWGEPSPAGEGRPVMTEAMSKRTGWRVVRTVPLLMISDGGLSEHG